MNELDKIEKELAFAVTDYDIERIGLDKELTENAVKEIQDKHKALDHWKAEYKKVVAKVNAALDKATKFIGDEKEELEHLLAKFYGTEINITKKVGDTEITTKEHPTTKFEGVSVSNRQNFIYDEEMLMQNSDFVRLKPTLDKIKVKAAFKEHGVIEGLEVEAKKVIKIKV
jgi:hypothetical protein